MALGIDGWGDGRIHGLRFEHGDVLCNGMTTNCGDRRASWRRLPAWASPTSHDRSTSPVMTTAFGS